MVDVAELKWLLCEAGPNFAGQSASSTGKNESRSAIALRTGVARKSERATDGDRGAPLLAREHAEIADGKSTDEMRRDSEEVGGEAATKPTIYLRIGQIEGVVNEIEKALIRSGRGLYRRGGLIVATSFDKMQVWNGGTVEVQIIEERENYALLEDIETVVVLLKFDGRAQEWRPTRPPPLLAHTLKQRRYRLRLPNLVALVNCPTIMANGRLMLEPGFDPLTGILFDPRNVEFPPVPDQPDKAMAHAALEKIDRLIRTFDFVSKDDKAVARSALLTGVARPGLPTAPLHGFDAPGPGAGKSQARRHRLHSRRRPRGWGHRAGRNPGGGGEALRNPASAR
jgi:hypothetical protein